MPSHDADKLEGLVFWCWEEYSGCFARNPRTYNFISKDKKLTQPWQLLWQPCHDEVLLPPKLNFKVAYCYRDLSGMTYLMLLAMRTSFLDRCKNKTNPRLTLLQDLVFPVLDSFEGFHEFRQRKEQCHEGLKPRCSIAVNSFVLHPEPISIRKSCEWIGRVGLQDLLRALQYDLHVLIVLLSVDCSKVCFPRVYYPGIASHISAELGLREEDDELVVLKLCNRSRAAGALHNFEIMVCTFGFARRTCIWGIGMPHFHEHMNCTSLPWSSISRQFVPKCLQVFWLYLWKILKTCFKTLCRRDPKSPKESKRVQGFPWTYLRFRIFQLSTSSSTSSTSTLRKSWSLRKTCRIGSSRNWRNWPRPLPETSMWFEILTRSMWGGLGKSRDEDKRLKRLRLMLPCSGAWLGSSGGGGGGGRGCGPKLMEGGESRDQQISSSLDSEQGIGGPTKVPVSWRMLGHHGWNVCFVLPGTQMMTPMPRPRHPLKSQWN